MLLLVVGELDVAHVDFDVLGRLPLVGLSRPPQVTLVLVALVQPLYDLVVVLIIAILSLLIVTAAAAAIIAFISLLFGLVVDLIRDGVEPRRVDLYENS